MEFESKKNIDLNKNEIIVILEIGGLGDFIMATPTIKAIRSKFSKNPIYLFVAERTRSLAEDFSNNVIDSSVNVIPFRTTGNYLIRNFKNFIQIKSISLKNPSLLIDLSAIESEAAVKRRDTFLKLFKSKIVIGRNTDNRGIFFNYSSYEILFSKKHEVLRKFNVIKTLGITDQPISLDFFISNDVYNEVRSTLVQSQLDQKIIIGINIGAYRSNRRWTLQNFSILIDNLHSIENSHFIIFGGNSDKEFIFDLLNNMNNPDITTVVGLSFQKVGAWISSCKLFITNDTGLMHFAAALHVPTIALFGPENPYRYEPWGDFPKKICKFYPEGEDTFTESNYFSNDSIQYISPEVVTEAACAYLKTGRFTQAP